MQNECSEYRSAIVSEFELETMTTNDNAEMWRQNQKSNGISSQSDLQGRGILSESETILPRRSGDVDAINDPAPCSVSPLVKWAGGKRGIIPQLQELMPEDVRPGYSGRLVEPFLGGAAMFFYLQPAQAILSDTNEDLINLYVQVRDRLGDLCSLLNDMGNLPYQKETYYEIRSSEPDDLVERAARFIFLNRWGWNGLYRVNKKGKFNVPFGATSSGCAPKLYNLENMKAASLLLQNAELRVAPFEETMNTAEEGDFLYLDPPYHPISSTSAFTSYTKANFSLDDQIRLRDAIVHVDERTQGKVRIMLSNSVAPEMVELYGHSERLNRHEVMAFRAISAKTASRGGQSELVVTNYRARND